MGMTAPPARSCASSARLERARGAGEEGLDHLLHLVLADGADDRVLDAALGHDHERGHALHAELLGDDRRLVDVDLHDLGLALPSRGRTPRPRARWLCRAGTSRP